MTRAFLKMVRAQAATTALRAALHVIRRQEPKEAERRILEMIAEKRPVLENWRRLQERKRDQLMTRNTVVRTRSCSRTTSGYD